MPSITPKNGISLTELAEKTNSKLEGDGSKRALYVCPIESPQKDCLTFAKPGTGPKAAEALRKAGVAAVMVTPESAPDFSRLNLLVCENPLACFFAVVPLFYSPAGKPSGIHSTAVVAESARLGANVSIGAYCVIGENTTVGDGAVLYPHVTLYSDVSVGAGTVLHSGVVVREECAVGAGCIIHNGTIIGADGFGYYPDPKKGLVKIPQIGNVIISDGVEIGANSCIDRAAMGSTVVGPNTKIDNIVQIGHGTKIGHNSILCGCCGIGGSCNIGNQVVLGGGTGVADHVTIADGVRTGGRSGVTGDITEKGDYLGFPAVPAREWRRTAAALRKLPQLFKKGLKGGTD